MVPLKDRPPDRMLIRVLGSLPVRVGTLELIKVLKMLLSPVLREELEELVEDLQTILQQIKPISNHPLKAPIHHPQENLDREIIAQDLMIRRKILLTYYSSPFQNRYLANCLDN